MSTVDVDILQRQRRQVAKRPLSLGNDPLSKSPNDSHHRERKCCTFRLKLPADGLGDATERSQPVLILSRRIDESIQIGDDITVTLLDIKGKQVRIGISAPDDVDVHREEVYERIQADPDAVDRR